MHKKNSTMATEDNCLKLNAKALIISKVQNKANT